MSSTSMSRMLGVSGTLSLLPFPPQSFVESLMGDAQETSGDRLISSCPNQRLVDEKLAKPAGAGECGDRSEGIGVATD